MPCTTSSTDRVAAAGGLGVEPLQQVTEPESELGLDLFRRRALSPVKAGVEGGSTSASVKPASTRSASVRPRPCGALAASAGFARPSLAALPERSEARVTFAAAGGPFLPFLPFVPLLPLLAALAFNPLLIAASSQAPRRSRG